VAYHALSACASREKESTAVSRESCARSRGRELGLIWNMYQLLLIQNTGVASDCRAVLFSNEVKVTRYFT